MSHSNNINIFKKNLEFEKLIQIIGRYAKNLNHHQNQSNTSFQRKKNCRISIKESKDNHILMRKSIWNILIKKEKKKKTIRQEAKFPHLKNTKKDKNIYLLRVYPNQNLKIHHKVKMKAFNSIETR